MTGSDLPGRAARGEQAEHVDLAPAQTTRAGVTRPGSGVAAGRVDLPAGVPGGGVEVEACAGRDQFARFGRAESGGEAVPELGQFGDMAEARRFPRHRAQQHIACAVEGLDGFGEQPERLRCWATRGPCPPVIRAPASGSLMQAWRG
jgi:hypothetical protein